MALYHYVHYYCYYNYYYIRRRPDTVVQFEHSSRCHICAVLCYLTFSRPIRLLRFACSWPLRANMTLSIKPEVHSVSQRRRMRTEPPLEVMGLLQSRFGYNTLRDAYDSSAIRARYNILRGVMCFRAIMNMSILLRCCRML